MDTDTVPGGESLSIDEAAKAYAATQLKEPEPGQPEADDETEATADDELQAPDEGEGETADGETDPDGEADDDPDAEPETERGRYVAHDGRVKLPDGSESTVREVIAGYMKDGDYRQKTEATANLKREAEARTQAAEAKEKQLEEQRNYVVSLVQSIIPPAPDPALLQTDPMGYMSQEAQRKQWLEHLTYLDEQGQFSAKERHEKATKEDGEKRKTEWDALLGKAPELKDDKRLDKFVGDLKQHGTSYGFTPQELASVALDHRQALVLKDAISWRKLQASKAQVAKKVEGRPPVQKGGKRLNPGDHNARAATDAMTRLKQSGSVEDATAAYLATRKTG